jgi:predicted GH43/DUF377 family glycosyl hydrolase
MKAASSMILGGNQQYYVKCSISPTLEAQRKRTHLTMKQLLIVFFSIGATLCRVNAAKIDNINNLPDWALGPFVRPANAQPVIKPDTHSVFFCPMRKVPVHWEARHTFNPGAVVKDGKIYVLYRAEDNSSTGGIGSFTSRIGLAVSRDGIHFAKEPKPVLFPAEDNQKDFEWYGGCEDPRLAERPDGTYYLTYTRYGRGYKGGISLGLATSKDLHNWTKLGSPFEGSKYANDQNGIQLKSAAIVHKVQDGRLVAAKIKGKYWMYFGEECVNLASSDDLIHWVPVETSAGKPMAVMKPRPGFMDSKLTEIGPQALLTRKGIVVFYNGKNRDPKNGGDRQLAKGVYTGSQALFDAADPSRLLARLDHPFLKPELAWEKSGQYAQGTTFIEGLVLFEGKWFLYYGAADTFVGVAFCDRVSPERTPKLLNN